MRGFAAFWLIIGVCFGAAAASAADSAPPAEPTTVLRFEIAPAHSRVVLTRTTVAQDEDAARLIENGGYSRDDFACDLLRSVKFADKDACALFPKREDRVSAESDSTQVNSSVADGRITIEMVRSIATADLFPDGYSLALQVAPGAEPLLQLEFSVLAPYALANQHPVPQLLQSNRAVYSVSTLLAASPAGDTRIAISIREGNGDNRSEDLKRGSPSLFDHVDADARQRIADELWYCLRRLGEACANFLPLALLFSVVSRRWIGVAAVKRDAKVAVGLLGALTLVGPLSQSFYLSLAYKLKLWDPVFWMMQAVGVSEDWSYRLSNFVMQFLNKVLDLAAQAFQLPFIAAALIGVGYLCSSLRWRAGVRFGRPLAIACLLVVIVFLLPYAVSGIEVAWLGDDDIWPFEIYALLVSLILLVPIISAAGAIGRLFRITRTRLATAGVVILFLVVLLPMESMTYTYSDFYRPSGIGIVGPLLSNGGYYIAALALAAAFLPVVALLARGPNALDADQAQQRAIRLGLILFVCALATPGYAGWWGFATVIAAIPIWDRLLIASSSRRRRRRDWSASVHAKVNEWVEKLERAADLQAAARGSALNAKLASGEMTPTRWSRARWLLEATRDRAVTEVYLSDDTPVREIVLGVGMERDPWKRAQRALLYALPVVAVLTAANVMQLSAGDSPLPLLFWLGNVVPRVTEMLALALLFGYFFDFLRGETGLHKALLVGGGLCLAELPIWLPRLVDAGAVPGLLWSFSQHFLILIPVGAVAFDYARMRSIEGQRFDWRRFSWFGDARILSAGVAATAAAIAPAVAALVSSNFADAVKDMASAVAPVLPSAGQ